MKISMNGYKIFYSLSDKDLAFLKPRILSRKSIKHATPH